MKIIILHGNALSALSQKLSAIKSNFSKDSIVYLDGGKTIWKSLRVEISTPNLFQSECLYIVEGLSEGTNLDELTSGVDATVVFKFDKEISKTSAVYKSETFKKSEVILLSEKDEVSAFPMVDSLGNKDKRSYKLVEEVFDSYGAPYTLTMIFYLLRRLVLPVKNAPPFVQEKLKKQKMKFNTEEITHLYKKALEVDFKIKTGQMESKNGLLLLTEEIIKTN